MSTCPSTRLGRLQLAALAVGLGAASWAHAELTDNLTISPTAMALGNAVTADPPGTDSIHFNPAGLARITGKLRTDSVFFASIRTHESFNSAPGLDLGGFTNDEFIDGKSSGPVSHRVYIPGVGLAPWHLPVVVAPGLGFAYNKEGSPFTFGTATYLPMAMTIDRTKDPSDPSRFDGRIVNIQRLVYLSPAVGYKVSDTLRVGVSVPIAHESMVFDTDMRMPNKLLGTIGSLQSGICPGGQPNAIDTLTLGLCGGGPEGMLNPFKKAANLNMEITAPFDPTLNIGVLWEPRKWLALGATYQGGSNTVYHGSYKFTTDPMLRKFVQGLNSSLLGPVIGAITGMPQEIPEVQSGHMVATIPYPERWQFGVKLKPTDRLQFNMDVSYANWAKWDALTFKFDQSIALLEMARLFGIANSSQLVMPMGMKNVVNYGFGVQVQVTNKLALRLGYEPRKSSVPANQLSLLAPLPDTVMKSVGLQYKLGGGGEINIAASYMTGKYRVPAGTDCNLNCDNFLNIIYNPYAGTNVAGDISVRYLGVNFVRPF